MKVIAVVVTFNRCSLLERTLARLASQTRPLDGIVVVDNGSTDGTGPWLARREGLTVVSQANVGGAGGFCTGMRRAAALGADWIWCMDDDVFPAPSCLADLLQAASVHPDAALLAPRRWQEGRIVCHDFTAYNLTNPLASMYRGKIARSCPQEPVYVAGTAFEGPLIRADVPARIGWPNAELFIFCDDTDYCLRAVLAGFRILYVPGARMDKALFFSDDSWAERERKKKWKRYYSVRNSTYLNHHYGRTWGVRYLRGFIGMTGYVLTALVAAPFGRGWHFSDVPRLWRAYLAGIRERLGRIAP